MKSKENAKAMQQYDSEATIPKRGRINGKQAKEENGIGA